MSEQVFVQMTSNLDYEISTTPPWTIRKFSTKEVREPKMKDAHYTLCLNGKREPVYKFVARQFLDADENDEIRLRKDADKKEYILTDIEVNKQKKKKKVVEESHEITLEEVGESHINIKSKITFSDVINQCPTNPVSKDDYIETIMMLREVFAVVNSTPKVYMFKDKTKTGFKIAYTHEKVARAKLDDIVIKYNEGKRITAWDFYKKQVGLFSYDYLTFYDDKPDAFSFFRGYDYKLMKKVDESKLRLFFNHVHNILCCGNEKVSDYFHKWFASILQNPDCKLETALIITGEKGCGKQTFLTDIWCTLLGIYAHKNISDIDHICGKFNATIENKKLIICNELQSVENNRFYNSDKLKSVITDRTISINQKGEPIREADNVANFIFLSNNHNPLKIENKDRRYVIVHASDEFAQNSEYFEPFYDEINAKGFYQHLYSYYMTLDISKFNHRNIPMTQAKEDMIMDNASPAELFIYAKYHKIVDIPCNTVFEWWNEWRLENKFAECSSKTFYSNIRKWTGNATCGIGNNRGVKVYNIKADKLTELSEKFPRAPKKVVEELEDEF